MLTWTLAALAAPPTIDEPHRTGASAPADAAIVIGIEDYLKVPDAPHAQADANAVYDLLLHTRGVPGERIRRLDNAGSREQILQAIDDATDTVGADGTLWFYFAGHGAADPSTGTRLLLGDDVPTDAFASRGVSIDEIRQRIGTQPSVLIIDACYSGLGRGGEPLSATRLAVPEYAAASTPNVLEWNAARPDELSGPYPAAKHGAFTYFVVRALRGNADGELTGRRDGTVTAEEAQAYVERELKSAEIRNQHPVLGVLDAPGWSLTSGELEGAIAIEEERTVRGGRLPAAGGGGGGGGGGRSRASVSRADRTAAIALGVNAVTNDPFVRRRFVRATGIWAATGHLRVEGSAGYAPSFGRADWKPITRQIIEENQVTPDLSLIQIQAHGAVNIALLTGSLGPFRFEAGPLAGLGMVQTRDDLEALHKQGEQEAVVTEMQTHLTAVYGGVVEVGDPTIRVRLRAQTVNYIEVLESRTLEMKNNLLVGPEVALWF